jgi:hypothetical protein
MLYSNPGIPVTMTTGVYCCHTKSHEENGVVEGEARIVAREYKHVALVLIVLVLYSTEPGIK